MYINTELWLGSNIIKMATEVFPEFSPPHKKAS